jgi:SHS2 domain-containing protein
MIGEYEVSVSDITIFVVANSEEEAISNTEQMLMESVWSWGSVEVV